MFLTDVHQLTIGRHQVDRLFQQGYTPLGLLALFDRDLGPALDAAAGVGQGYTIRENVLMVLGLFHYCFSYRPLPGNVSPTFMRLFLLLHDIGKPAAIARGNKRDQHAFNARIAGQVLDRLNYPPAWIALAQSLAGRDPLGRAIARGEIDAAALDIRRGAATAGWDPLAYAALGERHFCCDAGSYTVQGGGKTRSRPPLYLRCGRPPDGPSRTRPSDGRCGGCTRHGFRVASAR